MPASAKLAVVTGTTSGIGHALTSLLLEQGWDVVGVARRESAVTAARYRHFQLDLSDLDALVQTFEGEVVPLVTDRARSRIGLVNNAALFGTLATVDALDPHASLRAYAVNVVAPQWLMGFVVRHTPRRCALRILNVSSGAAQRALPGMGDYSGTKSALRMETLVAGAELDVAPLKSRAASDVALLSYSPGTAATPMQATVRSQAPDVFPSQGMFQNLHDSGALVDPRRPAAEMVAFLESAHAERVAERRLGDR